jgi:signal transduction histidine kinase
VKALRGRREQAPVALSGSGHGIAGMTERAVLVGGHLAATGKGERFVVEAWLPEHAETAA